MASSNSVKYISPFRLNAVRAMKTSEDSRLMMTGTQSDNQSLVHGLAVAWAAGGDAKRVTFTSSVT